MARFLQLLTFPLAATSLNACFLSAPSVDPPDSNSVDPSFLPADAPLSTGVCKKGAARLCARRERARQAGVGGPAALLLAATR